MSQNAPRIAIDAMGGDDAPGVVVRGTYKAAAKHPNWVLILVGDESIVRAELEKCGPALQNIALVHAPDTIGMNENPVEALRAKRNASLPIAVGLVREKKADAVISAGNTGALVAASTLMLRTLPGVKRAGILTTLPSLRGRIVAMDVGANVSAKPIHLMQYAVMGEIFYRNVLADGTDKPAQVRLLSVGAEEGKGPALIKETHTLLQNSHVNFVGNVEGHEIFEGVAPVIVCDGLVGNVVLKVAEGLSEILVKMFINQAAKVELAGEDKFKLALHNLGIEIDWREVGGAALLGVNGVVVIAHGRSDERAIASGIRTAAETCERHVNDQIVAALERENSKTGTTA